MNFKSGVKCRGSDRWWERRWWLWWGDMRKIRWTRRTDNVAESITRCSKMFQRSITRSEKKCCL